MQRAAIDPLVFLARCLRCLLELAQQSRHGHAAQLAILEVSEKLLLFRIKDWRLGFVMILCGWG